MNVWNINFIKLVRWIRVSHACADRVTFLSFPNTLCVIANNTIVYPLRLHGLQTIICRHDVIQTLVIKSFMVAMLVVLSQGATYTIIHFELKPQVVALFVGRLRSCVLKPTMVLAAVVGGDSFQGACLPTYGIEGNCYPINLPDVRVLSGAAVVPQLLMKISRLRSELALTYAQVSYIAAICPNWAYPVPQGFATRPSPCVDRTAIDEERAFAGIALRKISNKKMQRRPATTSASATSPAKIQCTKTSDAMLTSSIVKALNLEPVTGASVGKRCLRSFCPFDVCDDGFARQFIEKRAIAYEQGAGPNDSGSTASESSGGGFCVLCDEPACYMCGSGCGSFCETCFAAHTDDGRHWSL